MMNNDLIFRSALTDAIVDLLVFEWGYEGIEASVKRIFSEIPAVDAGPKWISVEDRLEQPEGTRGLREGKVTFAHPSGRWYTVEFSFPFMNKVRTYRECFFASLKPRIGVIRDKNA